MVGVRRGVAGKRLMVAQPVQSVLDGVRDPTRMLGTDNLSGPVRFASACRCVTALPSDRGCSTYWPSSLSMAMSTPFGARGSTARSSAELVEELLGFPYIGRILNIPLLGIFLINCYD